MKIPYGRQTINEQDIKAVVDALTSEYLTTGPKIKEFEELFAKTVGAKYAVAVANGTAALHLACLAAGLSKGDELITSPMTFAASANCALYCNAKPVFVDIKDESGLIDESLIEKEITAKTKIIIPVHYGGNTCNMQKIKAIAKKHNIIVIEDACHALGSEYKGTRIGGCKYSDMAVFSFHPVKHITTGEGGMITTNSKYLYERLLLLRTHGITKDPSKLLNRNEGSWFYEMHELGYNYRITDVQCALGISQLKRVESFISRRIAIAAKYDEAFLKNRDVSFLRTSTGNKNAYHLYIIKVKNTEERLNLFNYLKSNNVLCQVHYLPVYWHPYYQKLGYKMGLCPKAEDFYNKIISIPIYPELSVIEQDRVLKLIEQFFNKRILIVGFGSIGKRHYKNLIELGYKNIEVFDPSPNAFRNSKGVIRTRSLTLNDAKRFQIALICSPNIMHIKQALICARAGCNLFIEKPISHSIQGLDELNKICLDKGLVTLVGCNMRFHPCLMFIKEYLDKKLLGKIYSIQNEFGYYLPEWRVGQDYRNNYASKRAKGGGIILDDIHEFDLMYWLNNFEKAKKVEIVYDKVSDLDINTEDNAISIFKFKNKVLGLVKSDYLQQKYSRNCKIVGEYGNLIWDYSENDVRLVSATKIKSVFRAKDFSVNEMYIHELKYFMNCVEKKVNTFNSVSVAKTILVDILKKKIN